MPLEISLFDAASASEAEFAEHYDVMTAVMTLDHPGQVLPTLEEYVALAHNTATGMGPKTRWVAREDGHIIGHAYAIFPEHENRHLSIVRVIVTPTRRRQGIGSAMLRTMLPALGADGRTGVLASGVKVDASGYMWAQELGFVGTLAYVRQNLKIAEVDPALWQSPVPEGFRLESWTGAVPEELLGEYARARTAIRDAPNGDSTMEFEDWTPERVRIHEEDLRARGVRNRVAVAVHESSGRVAGFTELNQWLNQPGMAVQQDTAVVADFRGNGLGLAVKAAVMRWLQAEHPEVKDIFTQNAMDNTHMIRINHALGYTTTAAVTELEAPLAQLVERLAR